MKKNKLILLFVFILTVYFLLTIYYLLTANNTEFIEGGDIKKAQETNQYL